MFRSASILLTFFTACFCSASVAGEVDVDAPGKPAAKRFVGIELGPGILSTIQRNVRIDEWTQDEIDAYYEVLDFSRKTPLDEQKALAKTHLVEDIKQLREETEALVAKRIEKYDQLAKQHPERAASYERMKRAANRRLKQQLDKIDGFTDDPKEFPLMARMIKSMIEDKPSRFHGQLITLTGQVRKLISYDAHPNKFGVKRLYEAWMFTRDSGILKSNNKQADDKSAKPSSKSLGKIPVVIIFTEKPAGMPEGEKILEAATITGYVFRVHRYADFRDTLPPAPMLLAQRIEWHPRPAKEPTPTWMYAAVFAVVAGVLFAVFLVGRRDKSSRDRRRRNTLDETPPDFTETPTT